ncbi:hypothetical protein N9L68_09015, partial [bacterium]|nr:hypothetical protein [bacterium]
VPSGKSLRSRTRRHKRIRKRKMCNKMNRRIPRRQTSPRCCNSSSRTPRGTCRHKLMHGWFA